MKQITWYIGQSKDKNGNWIQEDDLISRNFAALTLVASDYGGYTAMKTSGGWVPESGSLIRESALRIETVSLSIKDPKETARQLAKIYNQTAVFVTVQWLHSAELINQEGEVI